MKRFFSIAIAFVLFYGTTCFTFAESTEKPIKFSFLDDITWDTPFDAADKIMLAHGIAHRDNYDDLIQIDISNEDTDETLRFYPYDDTHLYGGISSQITLEYTTSGNLFSVNVSYNAVSNPNNFNAVYNSLTQLYGDEHLVGYHTNTYGLITNCYIWEISDAVVILSAGYRKTMEQSKKNGSFNLQFLKELYPSYAILKKHSTLDRIAASYTYEEEIIRVFELPYSTWITSNDKAISYIISALMYDTTSYLAEASPNVEYVAFCNILNKMFSNNGKIEYLATPSVFLVSFNCGDGEYAMLTYETLTTAYLKAQVIYERGYSEYKTINNAKSIASDIFTKHYSGFLDYLDTLY